MSKRHVSRPAWLITWAVARAAAEVWRNDIHRVVPAWSYREIARNLRRSRKIVLSRHAVRRIVREYAPETFARRLDISARRMWLRKRRARPLS